MDDIPQDQIIALDSAAAPAPAASAAERMQALVDAQARFLGAFAALMWAPLTILQRRGKNWREVGTVA